MPHVRPFNRHDRDGLTQLANAHVAAVIPGGAVPTARLLGQLERDPDEYVVDPWVIDRHTLVAVDADRVVAAAHLVRYGRGEPVSPDYDDAAEITWLVCWPDSLAAGRAVLEAALDRMRAWGSRTWYADGNLPCPGVHGVPDVWPHVADLLEATGFEPGRPEVLFAGDVTTVDLPGRAPIDGLAVRRRVGSLGTRFDGEIDSATLGSFEVDSGLAKGGALRALEGWADVANLWVVEEHRGRGIGTWLLQHGCAWLRLGGVTRLLAYATEEEAHDAADFYGPHGITEIGRSRRGWSRQPD